MSPNRYILAAAAAALAASVLAAGTAYTIPRYSARYEQDCSLCHMNPTGGGERSLYASRYLVPEEMAVTRLPEDALEGIDPQLSRTITAGVDLRTFYFTDGNPSPSPGYDARNFFQMQGNLYLNLQLGDRLTAYMSRGMSGEYEVFGTGWYLPLNGYLKVGRFMPAYGWRFEDHTSYVRELMGFFPPAHTDVGVEAGIHPGRGQFLLSVTNGSRAAVQDFNRDVAVTGRGFYRWNLAGVGVGLGVSAYHNKHEGIGTRFPVPVFDLERTVWGPVGYLLAGPVTWVGEADFARDELPGGGAVSRWYTTQQLAWQAVRGVDVVAAYNYFNPDSNRKVGSWSRYGVGVEVMPYPFVKLSTMMNVNRADPGRLVPEQDYTQTVVQAHFFY